MNTQFRIFFYSYLLGLFVIAGGIYLAFHAHTDGQIALRLFMRSQTLLIIFLLSLIQASVLTFLFTHYWLKPLQILEDEMAAIAQNPEQLLAPPANKNALLPLLKTQMGLRILHRKVRQSIRHRQRLADAGEAVAKINHDLRNMLASVLLVTDQLETSHDPKVAQVAPVVIRATEQATELCQNMLDYLSELPPPEPVNIDMHAMMETLGANADVLLEYSGPDSVFTDRLMLFRILMNLLRNAQDAGAKKIIIDIWRAGHLAVIDISDNGPGIQKGLEERIFSAFTSGRPTHIGLGLAICLDLALALEGRLSLSHSTNEGCGFRLQLPVAILIPATA